MEEQMNFKKYIYVSPIVQVDIENIMQENNIIQTIRFINTYDIGVFFRSELKNLKGINYLILDLASFETSKDDDIIMAIKLIRQKYNARIIIIAKGYKQGNLLLGKIFNLGIYNIIVSNDDVEFREQFKKTITEEGMTFGNSLKYQVDNSLINFGSNKTVIKENYIKVKQLVNVGIASCESHQGATTLAINLVKFLNEFENVKACYIENNNHNTLESLKNLPGAIYLENKKMITYKGIDFYFKPENIAEIQKYEYDFYVYDFGAFNEMEIDLRNNFISRDLKLIVSGSRVWEYDKIAETIFTIGDDITSHLFINFLKLEERENFKRENFEGSSWIDRVYFSDFILDPFEIKNRDLYSKILKPYLLNENIKEEKKKGFFAKFKRKGKTK